MKKNIWILAILSIVSLITCAGGPKFSDVTGKEWQLIEVQVQGKSTGFDRSTLDTEGFGDIFTLNFDKERLSGTGAPNKYFAPYTLGSNLSIKIGTIAGTLMAALHEPEKLKENDFFKYLQNTSKWNLVKGNLHFSSKTSDGSEVTMIFALASKKKK